MKYIMITLVSGCHRFVKLAFVICSVSVTTMPNRNGEWLGFTMKRLRIL